MTLFLCCCCCCCCCCGSWHSLWLYRCSCVGQAVRVGVHTTVAVFVSVLLILLLLLSSGRSSWCTYQCCRFCFRVIDVVVVVVFRPFELVYILMLLLCLGRSCWCTYQCNVAVFVFVLVLILVLILMFLLCCSGGSFFLFVSKLHLLFCDILMQHVDHASLEPEAFSLTNECKAKRRSRTRENLWAHR